MRSALAQNSKMIFKNLSPFFKHLVAILSIPTLLLYVVLSSEKLDRGYIEKPLFSMHASTTDVAISTTVSTVQKDEDEISKTLPGQIKKRDQLITLLDPANANSIFTIVDRIQGDEVLSHNCHEMAHDIGHVAYGLYGFTGAMNFSDNARMNHASVQDVCAGGYVHGVLEEASRHQPEFTLNPSSLCADVSDANRASCFHGIGHALMFTYARDVTPALDRCRSTGRQSSISRCFEGVWMELFWGSTKYTGPDSLGFDVNKPLEPCTGTRNDAKPACFFYSPFGYLRTHEKDYAGAIRLCTKSNLGKDDSEHCLRGAGRTLVNNFKGHNLERSEGYVKGLSTAQKTAFYKGVFGYANFSGTARDELDISCSIMLHDGDICKDVLIAIE